MQCCTRSYRFNWPILIGLFIPATLAVTGCDVDGGDAGTLIGSSEDLAEQTAALTAPTSTSLAIRPIRSPTMFSGQTRLFTAWIGGQRTNNVVWSLSYPLGAISWAGEYTPPSNWTSWNAVIVTARSLLNPGQSASILQVIGPLASAPPATPPPPSSNAAPRPAWNTGSGFFVLNGKIYDSNGASFRPVGMNKLHWDAPSPGLFGSNPTRANAVRWVVDFDQSAATNLGLMQKSLSAGQVPIPGIWYVPSGATVTCDSGTGVISAAVNAWVAQSSTWRQIDDRMMLNIANEWGPDDSAIWRDSYISAIQSLRAAGYRAPLVVDSGGCGQDPADIVKYGQAVFDSDPQKNVIFDIHIYGNWKGSAGGNQWQTDLKTGLDQLKATGLPIICGEFGPGRNIGPSPTLLTPDEIMEACSSRGFGFLAWAWDDPAGEYTTCDDSWFCISKTGDYKDSSQLTIFGKDVIESSYGIKATALKASIFH